MAIPRTSSEDSFLSEPPEGRDNEAVALPVHLSLGMKDEVKVSMNREQRIQLSMRKVREGLSSSY
jgi:hypothetical protein